MRKILFGLILIILSGCKNKSENFEWNFNNNKNYTYSFSQKTTSENKMSKQEKSDNSYISGKGQIIITSKSENLADLSLIDLKVKMQNNFTKDTISQNQPDIIIQDLKSDGTLISFKTNDFIRLLFPLPNKNLREGEKCDIPMHSPYNINGSIINSKGFNSLKLLNYEVINGHRCAVLVGDIDISKLDLPENLEGNYEFSQIGKGTYYFDIENGYYIKSKIKITVTSLADNEDLYMSTKSTNEYEINLIDVTENGQNKSEKTQTSIVNSNKNTPIDIAKSVIEFLQKKDTTKYLNIAIPLKQQKKLFAENIKFNPQENDTMAVYRNLKKKYEDRTDNFLVRAGYILDIMKNDKGFNIENATIDSIYYKLEKIKKYGSFGKTLIGNWADLTVEMDYNNEKYYFEIPQIVKVDNEWFLYYPEYYLRDQKEKDFVERRVKELKEQSEEFWK
ncbi:hypothetical protein [Olleya sp. HaHaR_3_96]|uniref:hypothetical protein n=1 Tax=Olleya sp. HaHaR_3_96 TaxID=2745560 RepID=UPI001C4E8B98|nr:hypothetical protein [Olleya sp. HaHaR_3_96]QXP58557.1 hypothetical protein H0I26_11575 [Olleya sp. HaHaR_3_96]